MAFDESYQTLMNLVDTDEYRERPKVNTQSNLLDCLLDDLMEEFLGLNWSSRSLPQTQWSIS